MPNPKLETYKNKATGIEYDLTDADAQNQLTAIKDGTTIDSFGDVETDLAAKVDKVTGKGLSTNDYDNTAKGIVDNIQSNVIANTQLIKDTVGWSGKNKFKYKRVTMAGNEKTFPFTENGLTFTKNADDSVTVSGTASANTQAFLWLDGTIEAGNYIVNGCPSGGGSSKYDVRTDNAHLDTGNGVNITLASDVGSTFYVILTVYNGCNLTTPITFKPMLRDADILDDTFEPYFGSTAFPRSEQAVLGAKNFLPLTLASLKASTSGGSWADNVYTNGNVAYTISTNSAGYVTDISATGTADPSNDSYFRLMTNLDSYLTVGVDYILNGCPEGGGSNKYLLYTGSAGVWDDAGAGASKTYDNTIKNLFIKIKGGTTVTNKSFKPMIRLATDTDPTYAPYAMTNEQLTNIVQKIKDIDISLSNESHKMYEENGITILSASFNYNDDLYTSVHANESPTLGIRDTRVYLETATNTTRTFKVRIRYV